MLMISQVSAAISKGSSKSNIKTEFSQQILQPEQQGPSAASAARPSLRWLEQEDTWTILIGLGLVILGSCLFLTPAQQLFSQLTALPPLWSSPSDLSPYLLQHAPYLCLLYLLTAGSLTLAFRFIGLPWRSYFVGFTILFLLTFISILLSAQLQIKAVKFEAPLTALLAGLIISNTGTIPVWLKQSFRTEFYLKLGIILMGATLPFHIILMTGPIAIGQSMLISAIAFFAVYFSGTKLFKLDKKLAACLGGGAAVGNVTGVIAVAEACRAKLPHISAGISLVVGSSVALIFILTNLVEYLALPYGVAGAWIGSAQTADVAGFASMAAIGNETALQAYTLVKVIGRDMSVGLWAFLVATIAVTRWDEEAPKSAPSRSKLGEIWYRFPKFILGLFTASFLTAAVIFFLSPAEGKVYGEAVLAPLRSLRGWFFTLTFLSIGLNTRLANLLAVGWRPLGAFTAGVLLTAFAGYILSAQLFADFWQAL